MLVHGIRLAKRLDSVRIYVSQLRDLNNSERAGAEVIVRPSELADSAPEWLAWQHAIKTVQNRHGSFDHFLSLPPTAPLRTLEDVEKCLFALQEDIDIVVTMSPARRSPWFNMVRENIDGSVNLVINNESVFRRQDAPHCYDLATVAYAAKADFILSSEKIWDGKVAGIEVPVERALDIDTAFDFAIAEFLMDRNQIRNSQFEY